MLTDSCGALALLSRTYFSPTVSLRVLANFRALGCPLGVHGAPLFFSFIHDMLSSRLLIERRGRRLNITLRVRLRSRLRV